MEVGAVRQSVVEWLIPKAEMSNCVGKLSGLFGLYFDWRMSRCDSERRVLDQTQSSPGVHAGCGAESGSRQKQVIGVQWWLPLKGSRYRYETWVD